MGLMSEFRDFAVKGNAIDLAVGIVIGAEFGKIVNSIVQDIILPPIGLIVGNIDFKNFFITLASGKLEPGPYETLAEAQKAGAITMNVGSLITNIITFTIIAFAVFLVVKFLNKLKASQQKAN